MPKSFPSHRTTFFEMLSQQPGYPRFKKVLLLIGAVLSLVGLVLKLAQVPVGVTGLICGMGILGVTFFMTAYERPAGWPDDEEGDEQPATTDFWQSRGALKFSQKLWGWSLSIVVIALLFWICHWPGWQTLAMVGLPVFAIALALKLMCKSHQPPLR